MSNLIKLKQIESGDFQSLIEQLATGVVGRASGELQSQIDTLGSIDSLTGVLKAFQFSIPSGVDIVYCQYGTSLTGKPVITIGHSGTNQPMLLGFLSGIPQTTGVVVALSASTNNTGYYLNLHI